MSDGIDWEAKIGPWTLRDAVRITEELNTPAIRASVIAGAAILERALIRAVAQKLTQHSPTSAGDWEKHFERERIERIRKLAELLGILDARMSRALEIIARIRNRFAHPEFPAAIGRDDLNAIFTAVEIRAASDELARGQAKAAYPEQAQFIGACITLWRILTHGAV